MGVNYHSATCFACLLACLLDSHATLLVTGLLYTAGGVFQVSKTFTLPTFAEASESEVKAARTTSDPVAAGFDQAVGILFVKGSLKVSVPADNNRDANPSRNKTLIHMTRAIKRAGIGEHVTRVDTNAKWATEPSTVIYLYTAPVKQAEPAPAPKPA